MAKNGDSGSDTTNPTSENFGKADVAPDSKDAGHTTNPQKITLYVEDVPEIRTWKAGQNYDVLITVKQTTDFKAGKADFVIVKAQYHDTDLENGSNEEYEHLDDDATFNRLMVKAKTSHPPLNKVQVEGDQHGNNPSDY